MLTIAQQKSNHTLNQKFNYPEGIMTRREWIELRKSNGATVCEDKKPSVKWDRSKFNRMDNEEQRAYEQKLGTMIPCYKLHMGDGTFYEITKTEYEYFLSL